MSKSSNEILKAEIVRHTVKACVAAVATIAEDNEGIGLQVFPHLNEHSEVEIFAFSEDGGPARTVPIALGSAPRGIRRAIARALVEIRQATERGED